MSAICFFTSDTFETGDLLCVDSSTGYAVPYDSEDPKPVIGAVVLPTGGNNLNGRQYFAINGPPYYENDLYVWQDDLTSDFVTTNPEYVPFNPLGDTGYITCITNGVAAVKTSISAGIPSKWTLLKTTTNYDWYLIS
jgi:hypothetical protein